MKRFLINTAIFIAFLFVLTPLIGVVLFSLSSTRAVGFPSLSTLSLRWFVELMSSPEWARALISSGLIAIVVSPVSVCIAAPAAFVSIRQRGILVSALSSLIISPLVIPPIVLATGLFLFLDRLSLFDTFLGVVIAHQAAVAPVVFLLLRSRFRAETMFLYDTARLLGASPSRAATTWIVNSHGGTLVAAAAIGILFSFNEAILTIYVTDTNVPTLTKQAFSGIARDITPLGFAFLVVWWIVLLSILLMWVSRFSFITQHLNKGVTHGG